MTFEKDSFLGIIVGIKENDTVLELSVNKMTVNIEQTALPTATKITEEKKKYILDNTKLNVPEEFRQRYIVLLLKHDEVVSSSKYDSGKCTTSMPDIELTTSSSSEFQKLRTSGPSIRTLLCTNTQWEMSRNALTRLVEWDLQSSKPSTDLWILANDAKSGMLQVHGLHLAGMGPVRVERTL